MKKYQLLSAVAMGTVLAGCTTDETLSQLGDVGYNDGRISFTQKVGNTTRADQRAEAAGHYEFGVWAYKGAEADKVYTEGDVMTKYLVAYGDNTTGDANNNYKDLSGRATTYAPDANEGDPTVAPDGISTWFYEGLGSTAGSHKKLSSAEILPKNAMQSLKYWDKAAAKTNFFAYMPYFSEVESPSQKVTLGNTNDATPDMTFTGIKAFYTDPVVDANNPDGLQPGTVEFAGTYNAGNRAIYNREVLNANEALYAANAVDRGQYNHDVALTFKHINAKIKVAIWEAIPGYKVELINLVNEKVVAATSYANEYNDLALTPATKAQAIEHENHPQKTEINSKAPVVTDALPLPYYPATAAIKAASVTTGARSVLTYETEGETNLNKNLRFTIASDDAVNYTFRNATHKRISEVGGSSATVLNTTYYALPNVDQNNPTTRITNKYTAGEKYDAEKSVGFNTGYTFHVSYRLLPEDGSAPTEVYDARVWVAPEYCYWADGKQYTYIFKITTNTNGSTNPGATSNDIFGDGDDDPYVDPDDPRVPEDPALVPIVFDGIKITDYDEVKGFKDDTDPDDDTWQISNVESWPSFGATPYATRYCNYLMTADVYAGALDLSNHYYKTIGAPTAPVAETEVKFNGSTGANQYSFDYFDSSDPVNHAYFKASGTGTPVVFKNLNTAAASWGAVTAFHTGNPSVLDFAKTKWAENFSSEGVKFATYNMNIWAKDNPTNEVWTYTATPNENKVTVTPTLIKEVVTTTSNDNQYQRVETYFENGTINETKYYKANGSNWDEITEAAYTAAGTTDGTATYAYSFNYTYSVASDGYTVTEADGTAKQAYGIVVKKP